MLNLKKRTNGSVQIPDEADGAFYFNTDDQLVLKELDGTIHVIQLGETSAPLVFKGLLTQSSTVAPDIDIIVNTLGVTITPTRSDVGIYVITASDPIFTQEKTIVRVGNRNINFDGEEPVVYNVLWVSTTEIRIYSKSFNPGGPTFNLSDDVLTDNELTIEVYP